VNLGTANTHTAYAYAGTTHQTPFKNTQKHKWDTIQMVRCHSYNTKIHSLHSHT